MIVYYITLDVRSFIGDMQYFWKEHIKELENELKSAEGEQRNYLLNKINYMKNK